MKAKEAFAMRDMLTDYDNANSVGSRLRARRSAPLCAMIDQVYAASNAVNIIDVGGTQQYWNIVDPDYLTSRNVSITVVNLAGSPMPTDNGPFTFVEGDGCQLDFADGAFDIAHSNSVVEHVGDWAHMVRFAGELKRVARHYFVQTPNWWFPIEPHSLCPLFHWLPKPWEISLVRHFKLGHWPRARSVDEAVRIVESARLLNKPMMRELFGDQIIVERIMFLPKSLIAVRH